MPRGGLNRDVVVTGQAVAEGVDDRICVVDDALSGCSLVPAVADVDRIVVVNEGWLRLGVLVEGILLGEDPRHVRVDLRVILKLTQLEDVGGINHDDRLRRGLLRQLDHVLLGTRQLEVALAVLEVRVLLGVVRVAEVRVVSHLLIDIARQVESLATGAGDRHDRRITEGCGVGERQRHADDDQGDLDRLNHLPHIRPVDGKHC